MILRKQMKLFCFGLLSGAIVAVFLELYISNPRTTQTKLSTEVTRNLSIIEKYHNWLSVQNLSHTRLPFDEIRYTNKTSRIESEFLRDKVNVLCLVLVRKLKNAQAIHETWGQQCNHIQFYSLPNQQSAPLDILTFKVESSWQLLCETIRHVTEKYTFDWILFTHDNMFAILENLRMFLAPMDPNRAHYFGHSIFFWGVYYNLAQSGFVLSRQTVDGLVEKFNSSEACRKGGRFWKQEDYYLGRHLNDAGLRPVDTRDGDVGVFHGYNLYNLWWPGSMAMANYYKHAVYPAKCCSRYSVTFQGIDADHIRLYHYLIYKVQVFDHGAHGNEPYKKDYPDEVVWRKYLHKHGIHNDISSEQYYELWKKDVADPEMFNDRLRKTHRDVINVAHMPEVLDAMLKGVGKLSGGN